MSREERRQYQRQMKSMERGPALPPAAKARAERNAARREASRRAKPASPPGSLDRRFWLRTILIALAVGFLAFSLQWPNMPFAAYVGVGVGIVALAVQVGIRFIQRRLGGTGSDSTP